VVKMQASKRQRLMRADISDEQFDRMLQTAARLTMLFVGFVVVILALQAAHVILTPVALAIVIGLVFGPVADRLEARGIAPAASAGIVMVGFLALIILSLVLFAVPLAEWVEKGPVIWQRIQTEILNWKEPLEAIQRAQEQIDSALGGGTAMEVQVQDGSQVMNLAMTAPAILGDILIFLSSLYFYLATRENIRVSILSMVVSRRMRWRTAHIFNEVETKVSRFLLSVTLLNICVGIATAGVTFAFGLPSPLLWGVLAFVLNYIPYVGQAVMVVILLAVGFATQTDILLVLAPIACYFAINFVDGNIAFPVLVGRTMTLNPFLIFLSIVFWIWVWGPVGSLMAVPSLIILQSILANILPSKEVSPRRPVRRTGRMTEKDVVLANAAMVIKEQAEDKAEREAAALDAKAKPDAKPAPEPEPEPVPAVPAEAPKPAARKAPVRRTAKRAPKPTPAKQGS
jgi:predicted PurR-regulated permease PerM